jgi:broad specificity phosphatase PhoE
MCAQTDNRLYGRTVDVPLNLQGERQVEAVAGRLATLERVRIESSPRLRTRQTAAAIARHHGMQEVTIAAALDEIDFGAWSGATFAELEADPRWRAWNSQRSRAATPAGETMAAVYNRMLEHMHLLARDRHECTTVLVTHADVIRAVVLTALRASIDEFWRLNVAPASITRITLADGELILDGINECAWI